MEDESKYTAESGGIVRPVYSERAMRCLVVTESELKQIGLANIGVTVSFGIGSALIAFGLDIFKDTQLAESLPESADLMVNALQPLLIVFGLVFWVASGVFYWWRRGMIKLIEKESKRIT